MAKTRSYLPRSRKIQTTYRYITDAEQSGLILNHASSGDGAEWVVEGVPLKNFGSCSYMGLGRHPAVVEGAQAALRDYGASFSISRAYLGCGLYDTLEEALARITERHVVLAPSTTLAHLAALPVLVGERDLVLIDQFAHASMHMATELISDVPVELIRHSRLDVLEQKLAAAEGQYDRVWYLCDGVYSMLGDVAPFDGLRGLLERHPKLHVYVDDAHAMSWSGPLGRGSALAELGHCERVVVALSLAKGFGSTGGVLAFRSAEMRDRVRRCGGPMIFSGPIPPASLGASVASAQLHLTPGFDAMQGELHERIALVDALIEKYGLPMASHDRTPIFMIQYESSATAFSAVTALRERGFYCCVSVFPAVPMNKPSLRFTVSRHNPVADIEALLENLADVTQNQLAQVAAQ